VLLCSGGNHEYMLASPDLSGREAEYVHECIRTNWISSRGRFITAFESRVAEFTQCQHAVATCKRHTGSLLSFARPRPSSRATRSSFQASPMCDGKCRSLLRRLSCLRGQRPGDLVPVGPECRTTNYAPHQRHHPGASLCHPATWTLCWPWHGTAASGSWRTAPRRKALAMMAARSGRSAPRQCSVFSATRS